MPVMPKRAIHLEMMRIIIYPLPGTNLSLNRPASASNRMIGTHAGTRHRVPAAASPVHRLWGRRLQAKRLPGVAQRCGPRRVQGAQRGVDVVLQARLLVLRQDESAPCERPGGYTTDIPLLILFAIWL